MLNIYVLVKNTPLGKRMIVGENKGFADVEWYSSMAMPGK